MTFQRIKLGQGGEETAVAFLERQGCRILEQNFKNKIGEIDIVAQDGDTICFVEVKTRKTGSCGSPFESVTPAKQRKIARVASSYLKFKGKSDMQARFDVIAVFLEEGCHPRVEMIENAFEAS